MQITVAMVKAKNACTDGFKWFKDHFPDGGDYQAILDRLCEDDKFGWAE